MEKQINEMFFSKNARNSTNAMIVKAIKKGQNVIDWLLNEKEEDIDFFDVYMEDKNVKDKR